MPATILEQGPRNVVFNVVALANEGVNILVANMTPPCRELRLDRVTYDIGPAGSAFFSWDATVDDPFLTLTEGNGQTQCYRNIGGLTNTNAAGFTGNVVIDMVATATAPVHMVVHFVKKY